MPVPIPSRMPFGKYKGLFVSELPTDYLLWADMNLRLDSNDELMQEIRWELKKRQGSVSNMGRDVKPEQVRSRKASLRQEQ